MSPVFVKKSAEAPLKKHTIIIYGKEAALLAIARKRPSSRRAPALGARPYRQQTKMSKILCLETATNVCSAALFDGPRLAACREAREPNAHSRLLTVFIEQILAETSTSAADLACVAASAGPGSYTGLRIGVSAAKGMCYGAGIPLVLVPTLEIVAQGLLAAGGVEAGDVICAMIDARRMEVYHGLHDSQGAPTGPVEPHILRETSYADLLARGRVHFCGDGAAKVGRALDHPNAIIRGEECLSARHMLRPASERLARKQFADLAYDQPVYLKEFEAKVARPAL